ncbi:MAG: CPBP family intramembrane metalloprotease [Calditrichaeota bacterium]|nr:MAG: CPBP family intramembrane metalloprotease [Calditrichota bacterium]
MRFNVIKTIFLKELKETLRDKKVLFMMILLPMFLYPILFIGVSEITAFQKAKLDNKDLKILVSEQVFNSPLIDALKEIENAEIETSEIDIETVDSLKNAIGISIEGNYEESLSANSSAKLKILYDSTKELPVLARKKVKEKLADLNKEILGERLTKIGFDSSFIEPISIESEDIASDEDTLGNILGKIIPSLLIYFLLLGAIYPAIDLTAGEKERKTLQTIYSAPLLIPEIITGKFLLVYAVALASSFANILSMLGTLAFQFFIGEGSSLGFELKLAFSFSNFIWIFILLLLMGSLISAITMTVSLLAKSYKEAQSFVTPLIVVFIIPLVVVNLPGMELDVTTALIPILNVLLAMVSIFKNTVDLQNIFLVVLTTLGYAGLAIFASIKMFSNENVITGEKISYKQILQSDGKKFFGGSEALLFFFVVLLVYLYIGTTLQTKLDLVTGLILSQIGILGGLSLLVALSFKVDFKKFFQFNPFGVKAFFGSVLLAFSMWLPLVIFQEMIPMEYLEEFAKALEPIESLPFFAMVLVIGVLPGVFEELVFRGVIFSGLKNSHGKWTVILISALTFGIMHMSIFRLIPTFLIGIVLGIIVWETKSIILSIMTHTIHNSLLASLEKVGETMSPDYLLIFEENFYFFVFGGLVLVAIGLILVTSENRNLKFQNELK